MIAPHGRVGIVRLVVVAVLTSGCGASAGLSGVATDATAAVVSGATTPGPASPAQGSPVASAALATGSTGVPGPTQAPAPTPSTTAKETAMPFLLTSGAFAEGGAIPRRHTCDGSDASPALAWSGAPDGTVSLALIVDDPDARGFVHWVAFGIAPDAADALPEGIASSARTPRQGTNGFGRIGYGGPCPPSGTHHYVFTLYALNAAPALGGAPRADAVRAAMSGHVLAEARLTGTYAR